MKLFQKNCPCLLLTSIYFIGVCNSVTVNVQKKNGYVLRRRYFEPFERKVTAFSQTFELLKTYERHCGTRETGKMKRETIAFRLSRGRIVDRNQK